MCHRQAWMTPSISREGEHRLTVREVAGQAESDQERGLRLSALRVTAYRQLEMAERTLRLYCVLVDVQLRVSNQAHSSLFEADAGQSHRGGHIGILWKSQRGLASCALEHVNGSVGGLGALRERLSRCSEPCARRLAACVAHPAKTSDPRGAK